MKKNIVKWMAGILATACLMGVLVGCGKQSTDTAISEGDRSVSAGSSTDSAKTESGKYPFTFKDSLGTEFTLEQPLERIIVLNRQTAEAVKILGAEDKIIATGDTTIENNPYLGFNELPDMGDTSELNIEAIIGLEPDAVLVYTNRATEVLEEKLNPLGIPVIRIDNYQPEKYEEELLLLGQILDAEDRAKAFLEYRQEIEKMTAERIAGLSEEEKKSVMALSVGFINSNGGYRVFPSTATTGEMGVGEGYATLLAGGVDACPELQWDPAQGDTTIQVDEEYALSCNPDVITLHGTWLGGYNCTDPSEYQTVINNIYEISSIGQMKAGKDRAVYVFHTDMLGASKRHIGVLQLGKYLYPDLFGDVDVESYAREYFEEWLGTEYQGIWFYSAQDSQ